MKTFISLLIYIITKIFPITIIFHYYPFPYKSLNNHLFIFFAFPHNGISIFRINWTKFDIMSIYTVVK